MIKTFINRKNYLERIKPFINKDLIKVIVGQRRVGKSFLMYQIIDSLKKNGVTKENILYINKEESEFDFIQTKNDLYEYIEKYFKKTKTKKYLFLDEVQEIENFEEALRSLNATGDFDIYVTGSNSDILSSDIASHLTGRCIEMEVFPLSFLEFLNFHNLEKNNDSLLKYMKYGGLPYLKNLSLEDVVVYDYLKNVYSTILLKDVVRRYGVRNVEFLERLVSFIADNIGCIFSAKRVSDFLKSQKISLSPSIVLNYISYLCSTFFIFTANRFDIKGKKLFEVNQKYYFGDLGLRNTIISFKQIDIGKILENLVFMHLKIQGFKINVGQINNNEIDFIAEKNGNLIYIQVAYLIIDEKTKKREFENLLAIKDNFRKIVVSMDEFAGGNYMGIEHMHILDFLSLEI